MFKNSIKGLEELFEGNSDIPKGSVILVTGVEGSLKSGFAFNIISNYLAGNTEHGLYATLEETEESHLRNMTSLGIKKPERLHIFDYKDFRHEWNDAESDVFSITEDMINFYMGKFNNLTVFALDSLNALYSIAPHANLRKNLYRFFTMLRDKGLTSFMIMETYSPRNHVLSLSGECPEYFLSDGIIELGAIEVKENVTRYMQLRKLRAVHHNMEKHQIVVGKSGLEILGSIY